MDFLLAPRCAPASTVPCRPIGGEGEVAVADSSLAPGFAATPTSPSPLRKRATAWKQAWVTGVATLLLPSRLPRTPVTPMEERKGTGSAGWTRRWDWGGLGHFARTLTTITACPGHSHHLHRRPPVDQGTVLPPPSTLFPPVEVGGHVTLHSRSRIASRVIAPWSICGQLRRQSGATMAMAQRATAVGPSLFISRPLRRGWRTPEAGGRQQKRMEVAKTGPLTSGADG